VVNAEIAGYEVDAVWKADRFAVELDGGESHGNPAAVVRDRARSWRSDARATAFIAFRGDRCMRSPMRSRWTC
jgi:hypothetical protein